VYVEQDCVPAIGPGGEIAKPAPGSPGEDILKPDASELPDWEMLPARPRLRVAQPHDK
jgi:hypothetical protein